MTAFASEAPALLSLERVGRVFANGVNALQDISIDIVEGEFLSLLGPSGCGKSTLLRIIAGLLEPTTGSVRWRDAASDHRGQIGFVFQDPTLMPWASVTDNIWLPLRLRGISRPGARARIAESLALVGMTEFAHAYPHHLSGGMKMRVSIARALTLEPRLLLLDEPFAALDEMTRFRLNDDLQRVRRQLGCTVVFVTHSIFESVYLSDRIAVMTPRPGRIAATIHVEGTERRDADFRTSAGYLNTCRDVSQVLARTDGAGVLPT